MGWTQRHLVSDTTRRKAAAAQGKEIDGDVVAL